MLVLLTFFMVGYVVLTFWLLNGAAGGLLNREVGGCSLAGYGFTLLSNRLEVLLVILAFSLGGIFSFSLGLITNFLL